MKKVPEKLIKEICEASRMAPTSYGLQPWHVFVISDDEVKKKLHVVDK